MDWTIDRLQELRSDFAEGERQLNDAERRRAQLHDQLLRIEGAIRVLEEQMAAAPQFAATQPAPAPAERGG